MTGIPFTKGHGTQNDFVVLPDPDGTVTTVTLAITENIYKAFGSIAARRLAADATITCFSGKGMVFNYREQGVGEGKNINPADAADPDARTTVPDYYLRTVGTIGPAQICKKNADCKSGVCDAGMCRCQTSGECRGGQRLALRRSDTFSAF